MLAGQTHTHTHVEIWNIIYTLSSIYCTFANHTQPVDLLNIVFLSSRCCLWILGIFYLVCCGEEDPTVLLCDYRKNRNTDWQREWKGKIAKWSDECEGWFDKWGAGYSDYINVFSLDRHESSQTPYNSFTATLVLNTTRKNYIPYTSWWSYRSWNRPPKIFCNQHIGLSCVCTILCLSWDTLALDLKDYLKHYQWEINTGL